MLIDLHTHTRPISWDSSLSPDDLIERCKAAALDGVCLTEHDYFWNPDDLRALGRRHDYLVLPAAEINTEDGHILVYGIDRYVWGMHRSRELAHHVEEAGGVMIAAHPFRRQMPWLIRDERHYHEALVRASRNPAYQFCVALEKINGRAKQPQNEFAARLCDLTGMPGSAGTDAHNAAHVGRCATRFERDIHDIHELIEELKAGRFQAVDLTTPAAS
jgi:predicted metal-dependent phosphoesterase TrpH